MAISEEVREAVSSNNFKSLGEGPAFYANLAMSDAVAHQRTTNSLREGYLGQVLKSMNELDPSEARAQVKMLSGNDLAKQISDLGAAVATLQQYVKTAQSTPPETAKVS